MREAEALLTNHTIGYAPDQGTYWLHDRKHLERVPVQGVVIPDVRFQNELKAIQAAGGVVWRKTWDGEPGKRLMGPEASHASEHDINDSDCDLVLRGTADKAELVERVALLMSKP